MIESKKNGETPGKRIRWKVLPPSLPSPIISIDIKEFYMRDLSLATLSVKGDA
jgi:hypothetical protein